MTVIAGAFDLDGNAIPETLADSLLRELGKNASNPLIVDRGDRHLVAKLDIGAFSDGAVRQGDGFACAAGHPLLATGGVPITRLDAITRLSAAARAEAPALFDAARGTYLFVHVDPDKLVIAGDHCGVRPLYFTRAGSVLVFASALKILRGALVLTPCWQGRTEAAVFGYPLGDRTPFEGVFRIRESQWLVAKDGALHASHYHDWSASAAAPSVTLDELYATFSQAVALRLASSTAASRTLAFLSGGLDSRAVVSMLVDQGARVQALNFSPAGSQDREFARAFAAQFEDDLLKLDHFDLDTYHFPRWSVVAREALTRLGYKGPAHLWSGDGGSVGLGFVYLNQLAIASAARGDIDAAAREYLRANAMEIPNLILRSRFRRKAERQMLDAVVSEMRRYGGQSARRPHFFLLFNDQRRHLAMHFEDIDVHGIELKLPFFDGEFLKQIVTLRAEDCVGHRTYMQWFGRFSEAARAVPWQTYPGHVPCPLPALTEHSYQWDGRRQAAPPGRLAFTDGAPVDARFFRPTAVRVASLLHGLGIRDYGYVQDWVATMGGFNADRRL